MSVRKWHINPQSGEVDRCWAYPANDCVFGTLSAHFYDEKKAWASAAKKMKEFQQWNELSAVPQEEGWFTVYVVDPTMKNHQRISPLQKAQPGHRLILENGWIYENTARYEWKAISGESILPSAPIRPGKTYEIEDLWSVIARSGARIESNPTLPPFPIEWPWSENGS